MPSDTIARKSSLFLQAQLTVFGISFHPLPKSLSYSFYHLYTCCKCYNTLKWKPFCLMQTLLNRLDVMVGPSMLIFAYVLVHLCLDNFVRTVIDRLSLLMPACWHKWYKCTCILKKMLHFQCHLGRRSLQTGWNFCQTLVADRVQLLCAGSGRYCLDMWICICLEFLYQKL